MKISAKVVSQKGKHSVALNTNGLEKSVKISPKQEGFGSSVNGGELLFLALATCYCNDLYREARKRRIEIVRIEVEVCGDFSREGEAGEDITFKASVDARSPREEVIELMRHTDTVSEIQNTLRKSSPVILKECEAREV